MLAGVLTGCWLTLASAAVGHEAHLRALTRARSTFGAEQARGAVTGDVELWPTLGLHLKEPNLEGRLTYAPRLTLRHVLGNAHTQFLHAGRLQGEWRPRPGLRLTAEEYATYGTVDLFAQRLDGAPGEAPSGEVPLEPVPVGEVHFASSLTTLGWETTALHPRVRLWGSLAYEVGGGVDGEARAAVPWQHGPRLRVDARYMLTPLDGLTTSLAASDARFSTGSRAAVAQVEETWAHRFSRATDVELGALLGLTWARASGDAEARSAVAPGARASLGHRLLSRHHPLEARLTARVAPFVDRLAGDVYTRAEATLLLTWTAARGVWVYGQGGAARALGGSRRDDTLIQGGLGARWRLAPSVNLEADVRGNHQRQPRLQAAERFQWAATLGVNVSHTGMF